MFVLFRTIKLKGKFLHLEKFHVARLPLAQAVALLVAARHSHKEQADADVLQLQPIEQRQRCARA
jgi:hypothetical protein